MRAEERTHLLFISAHTVTGRRRRRRRRRRSRKRKEEMAATGGAGDLVGDFK